MLCTVLLFLDSFVNIVTITFTSLIFIETLNVLSTVHRVKFKMIVSIIFTIVIYMASIIMFRQYFDLSYVDSEFLLKVALVTAACWLPMHLF